VAANIGASLAVIVNGQNAADEKSMMISSPILANSPRASVRMPLEEMAAATGLEPTGSYVTTSVSNRTLEFEPTVLPCRQANLPIAAHLGKARKPHAGSHAQETAQGGRMVKRDAIQAPSKRLEPIFRF
jgi:hypothetical protein